MRWRKREVLLGYRRLVLLGSICCRAVQLGHLATPRESSERRLMCPLMISESHNGLNTLKAPTKQPTAMSWAFCIDFGFILYYRDLSFDIGTLCFLKRWFTKNYKLDIIYSLLHFVQLLNLYFLSFYYYFCCCCE